MSTEKVGNGQPLRGAPGRRGGGWVNVDRVWAGALVTAGTVTLIT